MLGRLDVLVEVAHDVAKDADGADHVKPKGVSLFLTPVEMVVSCWFCLLGGLVGEGVAVAVDGPGAGLAEEAGVGIEIDLRFIMVLAE